MSVFSRREAVEQALANARIGGYFVTGEAFDVMLRYADGELRPGDLRDYVKRKVGEFRSRNGLSAD